MRARAGKITFMRTEFLWPQKRHFFARATLGETRYNLLASDIIHFVEPRRLGEFIQPKMHRLTRINIFFGPLHNPPEPRQNTLLFLSVPKKGVAVQVWRRKIYPRVEKFLKGNYFRRRRDFRTLHFTIAQAEILPAKTNERRQDGARLSSKRKTTPSWTGQRGANPQGRNKTI